MFCLYFLPLSVTETDVFRKLYILQWNKKCIQRSADVHRIYVVYVFFFRYICCGSFLKFPKIIFCLPGGVSYGVCVVSYIVVVQLYDFQIFFLIYFDRDFVDFIFLYIVSLLEKTTKYVLQLQHQWLTVKLFTQIIAY